MLVNHAINQLFIFAGRGERNGSRSCRSKGKRDWRQRILRPLWRGGLNRSWLFKIIVLAIFSYRGLTRSDAMPGTMSQNDTM